MQGTPPGPDTSTSFLAMDEGNDNNTSRVSDDIVQLPSISPGLESSELYGAASPRDAPRQPVSKDSDASLSSSNSTGTVIVRKTRDGRKRASYSAFPNTARPGSSKSSLSLSTPQKPAARDTGVTDPLVSPISPNSPVSPDNTMPHERRVSSVPLYANLHASSQNSVNLQYPVIRPPSASASWYVHYMFFLWLVLIVWVSNKGEALGAGSPSCSLDLSRIERIFQGILRSISIESDRIRGVPSHGPVAFHGRAARELAHTCVEAKF